MKHHLNTLFVMTQGAYLKKDGETIVVRVEKKDRLRLPMINVGAIVCMGRISCSPQLMGACLLFRPARGARIETALRHPDEFTNVNQAPNSIFIDLTPFCSKSWICRSTRAGAMLQFQSYQVPLRPQMV